MTDDYIPDRGDIIWINFDPQKGREQAGRRPAVVLSPASYNRLVGLLICCPTTTRIKGYAFEVRLAGSPASVVLTDQIKSMDWRRRDTKPKGRALAVELDEIQERIGVLLGL